MRSAYPLQTNRKRFKFVDPFLNFIVNESSQFENINEAKFHWVKNKMPSVVGYLGKSEH
jgi:hypothetical protein